MKKSSSDATNSMLREGYVISFIFAIAVSAISFGQQEKK